jgi:hypothetical protein
MHPYSLSYKSRCSTTRRTALLFVASSYLLGQCAGAAQRAELTAIERAFGRGIPRYLGDYGDVFDELLTAAGLEEVAV